MKQLKNNLDLLSQLDNDEVTLTDQEIETLKNELVVNVDRAHRVMEFYKWKIDYASQQREKWAAIEKAEKNNLDRIKKSIISAMTENEWLELNGLEHTLKISNKKTQVVKSDFNELSSDQYLNLIEIDGKLAKAKYTPQKKEIKDFHIKNPGVLDDFVTESSVTNLRWSRPKPK